MSTAPDPRRQPAPSPGKVNLVAPHGVATATGRRQSSPRRRFDTRPGHGAARLYPVFATLAILFLPMHGGYAAQDEHNRRFAMELVVIAGDLRLLRQDGIAQRYRRGLVARITSALGFLGLLAREAQQAGGRDDTDLRPAIRLARKDFLRGDLAAAALSLRRISQAYPLDTRGILPVEPSSRRLERGRAIYQDSCRACHISPDKARDNPAPDLFRDAMAMPEQEFVARLLAGVRGLPRTGLENPLSDEDLRSLIAWLRQGGPVHRAADP